MREFILTVIGVSLVCSFASILSPEGKGGGLRSCLGFVSGLCALAITAGPLLTFIGALRDGEYGQFYEYGDIEVYDYEKIFDQTLIENEEKALKEGLLNLVISEFGIEEKNIDIDVALADNGETLVTVTLGGRAVFTDAHSLAERVESLLSCECRVVYGGNDG